MNLRQILLGLLAIIGAIILGAAANMGIIIIGPSIIPAPEGVNVADVNSLRENIHLYEGKHFIMPFLAHAIGTLIGVYVVVKIFLLLRIKKNYTILSALIISLLFLWGGLETSIAINAPQLALILDALLCYVPMGIVGYYLARIGTRNIFREDNS